MADINHFRRLHSIAVAALCVGVFIAPCQTQNQYNERPPNDEGAITFEDNSGQYQENSYRGQYSEPKSQYSTPENYEQPAGEDAGESTLSWSATNFAVNMLKEMAASNTENFVVSPLSVGTVLALLAQGAEGRSLLELESALGLQKDQARQGYRAMMDSFRSRKSKNELSFANGVFVNRNFDLKKHFKNIAVSEMRSNAESLDFSNVPNTINVINNWVSRETKRKITSLLSPENIDHLTQCVLANAVYFKGTWKTAFSSSRTKVKTFYPQPGVEVMASMMYQGGKFPAGQDDKLGAKWLELPFEGDEFSMVFVMPTAQHELSALISRMNASHLSTMLSTRNNIKVTMGVPKFDISHTTQLARTLMNMGVRDIFTPNSGLINIANQPMIVGQAIQKATFSVDEQGAQAAAATAFAVNTLSLSGYLEEFIFILNQPFLVFIVDKVNQVPIFVARIVKPTL